MPIPSPKRISGRDNPDFKRFLAARARKDRERILVEGSKLIAEARRSNLAIEAIGRDEAHDFESEGGAATRFIFASPLMKSLSDVETPQGVIAMIQRPRFDTAWLNDTNAFVLVLDNVQDPGNVGTLFRTAEATGVSGVLMTIGCADPLSAKALRASAGSAFRVPHRTGLSPDALRDLLPKAIALITTSVDPKAPSLFDASLKLPLALALGSEGSGLDPRIEKLATTRVRVPQARAVESLNVAVAGAVVLFDIARRAGILRV